MKAPAWLEGKRLAPGLRVIEKEKTGNMWIILTGDL